MALEAMPSAMAVTEYEPTGKFAGRVNADVTGVLPVATTLVQPDVVHLDVAGGGIRELHDRIVLGHIGVVAVGRAFVLTVELGAA